MDTTDNSVVTARAKGGQGLCVERKKGGMGKSVRGSTRKIKKKSYIYTKSVHEFP